jgi:riboflavin synthase
MFTGLIEEIGTVSSVKPSGTGFEISVKAASVLEGVKSGDSIAINGVCQSVTSFGPDSFTVFSSRVTADITTLAELSPGTKVNLERALTPLSRMGGHIVQGHVDGTGVVTRIMKDSRGTSITIGADAKLMRYIVAKGSVAVNGISLTVVSENGSSFDLYLIPDTVDKTTIPLMKQGDRVNIETDILAKYAEKMLTGSNDGRLMRKLSEGGFV